MPSGSTHYTYIIDNILTLLLLGPSTISLYGKRNTTFSLLPPGVNRADIPLLTQNVILSMNLVGTWHKPDGSYIDRDSITIPTLHKFHAGLYQFYASNWDGDRTLAIQIEISPVGEWVCFTKNVLY